MLVTHPIPPVFDERSRILILGSFPSVKSREVQFFYGHPQNRFWPVVSAVFGEPIPRDTEERRSFLLRNRIALWDVIASCEIHGSADNTIRNTMPNDLSRILNNAKIEQIFVNGKTAESFYRKYAEPLIGRSAVCLPSTSPANAAWSKEKLTEAWKQIKME